MMKPGTRIRITTTDPAGRWQPGDTGILEQNDFDKYDYRVLLDARQRKMNGGILQIPPLAFYFYRDEVDAL